MISAYTDEYLPILGDYRDTPPMRQVALTRYDGDKFVHGVVSGVVLKLHIRRVYSSPDRQKFKRSQLLSLLYTEVV